MKKEIWNWTAYLGDCLEKLKELPDNSVDAIITDPPYWLGKEPDPVEVMKDWIEKGYHEVKGKGFMWKERDAFVPQPIVWKECLRVLKPGWHLLTFAGTRTQDWMAMSLRFAWFEVRDMVAWVYWSWFPKSLNIWKAVDKIQGNERDIVWIKKDWVGSDAWTGRYNWNNWDSKMQKEYNLTKWTSEREWRWTALKPALEPITMARKPIEKWLNVAQNCLKWWTGGINIDESRVESDFNNDKNLRLNAKNHKRTVVDGVTYMKDSKIKDGGHYLENQDLGFYNSNGRFPANLIHDNSEEVRECFPETKSGGRNIHSKKTHWGTGEIKADISNLDDSGNASRFFKSIAYHPKASKAERNRGCEGLEKKDRVSQNVYYKCKKCGNWIDKTINQERKKQRPNSTCQCEIPEEQSVVSNSSNQNNHPTVKPIALMEYLIKMITPKGGVCLDPFMGSGSTGVACKKNGFDFIGIEMEEEYMKIAEERIENTPDTLF